MAKLALYLLQRPNTVRRSQVPEALSERMRLRNLCKLPLRGFRLRSLVPLNPERELCCLPQRCLQEAI